MAYKLRVKVVWMVYVHITVWKTWSFFFLHQHLLVGIQHALFTQYALMLTYIYIYICQMGFLLCEACGDLCWSVNKHKCLPFLQWMVKTGRKKKHIQCKRLKTRHLKSNLSPCSTPTKGPPSRQIAACRLKGGTGRQEVALLLKMTTVFYKKRLFSQKKPRVKRQRRLLPAELILTRGTVESEERWSAAGPSEWRRGGSSSRRTDLSEAGGHRVSAAEGKQRECESVAPTKGHQDE